MQVLLGQLHFSTINYLVKINLLLIIVVESTLLPSVILIMFQTTWVLGQLTGLNHLFQVNTELFGTVYCNVAVIGQYY